VPAVDRGQRAFADRTDVETLAGLRSTPDHMLRIGRATAVLHDDAIDHVDPEARVVLVPGLGCVAAAPDGRTARVRAEIAAHTHAAVAATLDAFGGASWLDEREVDDFENWPLEL